MVITLVLNFADPGPNQSLVFCEGGENAKDDGNAGIRLNAHEAVGHGVRYVLEVHDSGFAFDQNTDGDHRVKGSRERRAVSVDLRALPTPPPSVSLDGLVASVSRS